MTRTAVLLWAVALPLHARDISFDGKNTLHPEAFAGFRVVDHRIELNRGAIVFRLVDSSVPPVEIVTPNVTVRPLLAGECRVEVTRFGETQITPGVGEVRVIAPQGANSVMPGEKMIVRGSAAAPEFRIVSAISRLRRLANGINSTFGAISLGAGAATGSDEAPASTTRPSKPAEPSKPPARSPNPDHPNQAPSQTPHAGHGK